RPPEAAVGAPADHDLGPSFLWLRADAAGEADLLAAPESAQVFELAVEQLAALVEVDAAHVEVVLAPADREPEREPPAREDVERRCLLGQQGVVAAKRAQQHGGQEA